MWKQFSLTKLSDLVICILKFFHITTILQVGTFHAYVLLGKTVYAWWQKVGLQKKTHPKFSLWKECSTMSFRLHGVLPTIFQVNLGCLDILRFSSSVCSKDNLFHGLDAFCITQPTVQTAKHRRELRTLTATRENHPPASFFLDLLPSSESTPLCLLSNTVTYNSAMNGKWCCWCVVKLSARIVLILKTKPSKHVWAVDV